MSPNLVSCFVSPFVCFLQLNSLKIKTLVKEKKTQICIQDVSFCLKAEDFWVYAIPSGSISPSCYCTVSSFRSSRYGSPILSSVVKFRFDFELRIRCILCKLEVFLVSVENFDFRVACRFRWEKKPWKGMSEESYWLV